MARAEEMIAVYDNQFVLGVDLDGVCGDYTSAFARVVAAAAGVDVDVLGPQTSWEFVEAWAPHVRSIEHYRELHKIAVLEHRIFATMDEIPGVSDALWQLSDAGVHIRIITHRLSVNWGHDVAVADTVAWLQQPRPDGRPRIPYRDICFMSDKTDVGCDLLIDDAPHNILGARRHRIDAVVFDAPYNQHVPGARARDWGDVVEHVVGRVAERQL